MNVAPRILRVFFPQKADGNQRLPEIIRRPNKKRAGGKRLHERVDGDHRIRQHVRHRAKADPRGAIIREDGEDRHRADGRHVNEDGNEQMTFQFGQKNRSQTGGEENNGANQKFAGV